MLKSNMILESRKIIEEKMIRVTNKPHRVKRKRIGTYRVVSDNNDIYVLEKKKKFFCWRWWSRNYLYDINGCYIVNDKDTAKRILKILTQD